MSEPLLSVEGLKVALPAADRADRVLVGDVSFAIAPGRTLAIVGESGSGKSITCRAVMGLLPEGAAVSGSIRFDGIERVRNGSVDAEPLRGRRIGMVFQNAASCLNPVRSIGAHLQDALARGGVSDRTRRRREAVDLLARLMLPEPEALMRRYPHELSGGQNQRVMLALALAQRPGLLIADEATTALDVLVQAQILALLHELSRERGLGVLLVTHDLGVAARQADEVCVVYRGYSVERSPTSAFFEGPRHPYAAALLASAPSLRRRGGIDAPPETMLSGDGPAQGCAFAHSCPRAAHRCRSERPILSPGGPAFACHDPIPSDDARPAVAAAVRR